MEITLDHALAIEAKAMVALAFRNGPIEALHAGKPCAVCSGNPAVSHISDEEMKAIMKSAVDTALPPSVAARERFKALSGKPGAGGALHRALG